MRVMFFLLLVFSSKVMSEAEWRIHYMDGGYLSSDTDGSFYSERPISDSCWELKTGDEDGGVKVTTRCEVDGGHMFTDSEGTQKFVSDEERDAEMNALLSNLRETSVLGK